MASADGVIIALVLKYLDADFLGPASALEVQLHVIKGLEAVAQSSEAYGSPTFFGLCCALDGQSCVASTVVVDELGAQDFAKKYFGYLTGPNSSHADFVKDYEEEKLTAKSLKAEGLLKGAMHAADRSINFDRTCVEDEEMGSSEARCWKTEHACTFNEALFALKLVWSTSWDISFDRPQSFRKIAKAFVHLTQDHPKHVDFVLLFVFFRLERIIQLPLLQSWKIAERRGVKLGFKIRKANYQRSIGYRTVSYDEDDDSQEEEEEDKDEASKELAEVDPDPPETELSFQDIFPLGFEIFSELRTVAKIHETELTRLYVLFGERVLEYINSTPGNDGAIELPGILRWTTHSQPQAFMKEFKL
ncbi:hypothetical protein BC829DRAFT_413414 [Chytridium lagenaria]|nr:hypothetical protein BC829DRAFT_413414 [Chytridium lagenaria]